ncbi:MAG TPA: XdhC family protein [Pyrinomonadaceae bacterium]|nr:XdhC family protein [Pyrinomonadaceae bacterium]
MRKDLQLWQFILERLQRGDNVMLLVVAESAGSSPGRRGYKMAVGADGELFGSIGGGVMEVRLVEESRIILRDAATGRRGDTVIVNEQVHRRNVENASGMICSGKQTVIFKLLTSQDSSQTDIILASIREGNAVEVTLTGETFSAKKLMVPDAVSSASPKSKIHNPKSEDFCYTETLGSANRLYIIGGGHCALALSELMSRMDFHITLLDDRPELNTIDKNDYADDIKIVDSYERISDHICSGRSAYVVVMTLGYETDETVIRGLLDKEFKYFGVLGSKAKMATMFRSLREDGIPEAALSRIRTPVGLPINSHTPEEIAVSIAAEIISVKNAEP